MYFSNALRIFYCQWAGTPASGKFKHLRPLQSPKLKNLAVRFAVVTSESSLLLFLKPAELSPTNARGIAADDPKVQ